MKVNKTESLIESAIDEFARAGYQSASTAIICQNAGVSKGLLFHHFKTKKGLYLHIYETILERFTKEFDSLSYDDCETYYDVVVKMGSIKLNYYISNPKTYKILLEANYSPPAEISQEIREISGRLIRMEKYFSLDMLKRFKMREGVRPEKAWEVVSMVSSMIEKKIINKLMYELDGKPPGAELLKDITKDLMEYMEIVFYGVC